MRFVLGHRHCEGGDDHRRFEPSGRPPKKRDSKVNESAIDRVTIERRFPDGRLAEVLDLGFTAFVRVHAASGKVYIEQRYGNIGEAIAAITDWNGEGYAT
jgi:hypothetical protein